ncbi:MAG TPA: HdeD family acid-resistance protein [Trebonia sp.]|nr:HdeD family acid-resistance protein [Trebonia sp.]
MEPERPDTTYQGDELPHLPQGWRAAFFLGLLTLVLGVIVTIRPTQSLTVVAVLLGVTLIVSGAYHIVRAFDGGTHERVWRGIAGVLFILGGLVLIRHLDLSLALIGLFVGFTWIIQGISSLLESPSRGLTRPERRWSVFFSVISLIAGIVVIAMPIVSLTVLTTFVGVWFMVMGAAEMIGALFSRPALRRHAAGRVSVPGQRASEADRGRHARAGSRAASETAPAATRPTETGSPETGPTETAPRETAPRETAPSETTSSETTSSERAGQAGPRES